MMRTFLLIAAAAGFLMVSTARADDATETDTETQHEADDALKDKADVPSKPPVLPDTASDRATYVHENIAFGKQGEAMRLAHRQAEAQGKADAADVARDAANRAAHGAAASAAGAANADGHDKAGHDRANAVRPTQLPTQQQLPTPGRR